jgi:DNA repair exonuclease SbcCD ATPase subunit
MKIERVLIENFLTIGKAEIELADRGLILVQGDNRDDTSANSNGAGKSSIADAICWALYGVTARNVSGDGVVNRKAKKDCAVEIVVSDDKDQWRIIRHRKHTTGKNTTIVQRKDPTPGRIPIDLHKGTERETQEVIDALIGCSLDVFQAAVYAGQEKMPDLPAMTDKQLKLMIEEAAGVEVLAKAYEIARSKLNTYKTKLNTSESKRNYAALTHVRLVAQLADETVKHADFEAQRTPLAKSELAEVVRLKGDLAKFEAAISIEVSACDRPSELAKISAVFASLDSEKREMERLEAETRRTAKALTLAEMAARVAQSVYKSAVEALRNNDEMVGKPCGECGKTYCAHDLESVRKLREADLEAATKELKKVASEFKTARDADATAQTLAIAHRSSMTDVSTMAARHKQLISELDGIKVLEAQSESCKRRIEEHISAAKLFVSRPNPYTSSVETLKRQEAETLAEISAAEAEIKAIEKLLELAELAVSVYGPAGVRAHILDTVTPYLNDRTSHYLATLADGNISAVWNTLTKNAKGELKEKFCIEVSNNKGADSFEGLSGGEKRKVRLACAMALQDMVASRATKPINIFIADEVDHALDASGLERLMTVLNDKAKERGTVMVISHSDLKDWIDDVITVTKKDGYGQVTGATRRS